MNANTKSSISNKCVSLCVCAPENRKYNCFLIFYTQYPFVSLFFYFLSTIEIHWFVAWLESFAFVRTKLPRKATTTKNNVKKATHVQSHNKNKKGNVI